MTSFLTPITLTVASGDSPVASFQPIPLRVCEVLIISSSFSFSIHPFTFLSFLSSSLLTLFTSSLLFSILSSPVIGVVPAGHGVGPKHTLITDPRSVILSLLFSSLIFFLLYLPSLTLTNRMWKLQSQTVLSLLSSFPSLFHHLHHSHFRGRIYFGGLGFRCNSPSLNNDEIAAEVDMTSNPRTLRLFINNEQQPGTIIDIPPSIQFTVCLFMVSRYLFYSHLHLLT